MSRVLAMPATIVMLLLLAVPVAAQDTCEDPESDFGGPFLCGQIGVNLEADAEATIEEVLARSAPDAEVIHQAVPPAETSYIVGVPEGDEWANVQALREDPDVEIASLIGSGETGPVPDTATEVAAPQNGVAALTGLIGVALAFLLSATLVVRGSGRKSK